MRVKDGKYKRWFTLLVIALTIAVMTELPYMRWAMYEPLREALGLSHAEFGVSMSVFGTVAMLLYLPGGFIADRVSHRKLFAGGAIGGGLLGFWFMTLPGYWEVIIIHALWAVTNIMMVWPTMIKAVSVLGSKEEQGKLFGLFEGVRGIFIAIVTTLMTTILVFKGASEAGVSAVIFFVAISSVLCGVVAWFCMEDNTEDNSEDAASFASIMRDLSIVVRMPSAWVCAGIMFCVYSAYATSTYMNPYMQEVFGISAVVTGYLTVIRKDIIRIAAAPLSGILSARYNGENTRVIRWFAWATIATLGALLVMPESHTMTAVVVAMLITCVSSFCMYGMRGLYYAVIGEVGTPKYIYGAVAGFCSMLAFSPDAYNNILVGYWLDSYGTFGYKIVFVYMIATLLVLIGLCRLLVVMKKRGIQMPNQPAEIAPAAEAKAQPAE